eukprot:15435495-Alexandrium_andersonii.AAC.1
MEVHTSHKSQPHVHDSEISASSVQPQLRASGSAAASILLRDLQAEAAKNRQEENELMMLAAEKEAKRKQDSEARAGAPRLNGSIVCPCEQS